MDKLGKLGPARLLQTRTQSLLCIRAVIIGNGKGLGPPPFSEFARVRAIKGKKEEYITSQLVNLLTFRLVNKSQKLQIGNWEGGGGGGGVIQCGSKEKL